MKLSLLLACVAGTALLTSCAARVTLENRRDLYSPQTVWGPYTRMLHDGSYKLVRTRTTTTTTTVTTTTGAQGDYKNVVR